MSRQSTKARRGDGEGHSPVETTPTPTLDTRVSDIEAVLLDIRRTLDAQFHRIAAIQAQLDHLSARKLP
jgi:hypothetical protein